MLATGSPVTPIGEFSSTKRSSAVANRCDVETTTIKTGKKLCRSLELLWTATDVSEVLTAPTIRAKAIGRHLRTDYFSTNRTRLLFRSRERFLKKCGLRISNFIPTRKKKNKLDRSSM